MLEIVALFFLTRHVAQMARAKGLKPFPWQLRMVLSWFAAELLGIALALQLMGPPEPGTELTALGPEKLLMIMGVGLVAAFGGYLLIRFQLERMPAGGNTSF
jgi:hypothetical protein